jgi:putative ABC transport system permease protein
VLGAWGLNLLVPILPLGIPGISHMTVNGPVLVFTAALSILTGLIFGVAPALQTSKTDLAGSLKESGRGALDGSSRNGFRNALVAGQIGLSLVLLIGAGLMINSFLRLERNELGADPTNLLTFEFRFPQNQLMKQVGRFRGVGLWEIFPATDLTYDRVLERVRGLPGVQSAAMASIAPMSGRNMGVNFRVEGKAPPSTDAERQALNANYVAISPNYFATLRISLLRGRDFIDRDNAAGPLVIAVNQSFVRRFLPDEDPIGKRVTFDFVPNEQPREIVAVVADSRVNRFQKDPFPTIYVPHLQQTVQWKGPSWGVRAAMTFILKTAADPMALAPPVRSAIAEIDSSKPAGNVRTVEQSLEQQLQGQRVYMLLLGVFGAVAAILAAVGIYGVMAYSVAQRTHEIGIRMALGAGRQEILGMVVRRAVLLIGIGILAGLAGAFGLTRFLASDLWGVTATDPPTYIAVSVGLAVVAILACVIPTRRAVRVDPTIALRYE